MSLDKILEETNTDKYFIEYKGFLSNHVAHGIIALHRLGASEERIQEFIDWYKDRLEEPHQDEETGDDTDALKGKRVCYYKILLSVQNLLKDNYKSIEGLIAGELPKYSLGLGCSAFHGIIQLGYGFSTKDERRVCEGLAYLHHSYLPLVHQDPFPSADELGKGTKSPLDLLHSVKEDKLLHNKMIEGIKKEPWSSMGQGYFQCRLAYLIQVHGDHFVSLLSDLKLDTPRTENGDIDVVELGKQIVDIATTAYTVTEPANDFFMLHGVTSAWSILQILPLLNAEHGLEVIEVFLIALLATYMCEDCPKLPHALNPPVAVDSKQWDNIIAKTLAESRDEHIYKLVQVAHDMWKMQPGMGHVYTQAAETALNNPLTFVNTKSW